MTKGRRVTIHLLNASLRRRQSSPKIPVLTSTPAACSCGTARPRCRGLTSSAPITTVRTPALMSSLVQAPVRPCVEQGSSVTYKVASGGTRRLRLRRHAISAWGAPVRRWCPFATMQLRQTSTAPTAGFGLVRPRAFFASCKAAPMKRSSCCEAIVSANIDYPNSCAMTASFVGNRGFFFRQKSSRQSFCAWRIRSRRL